MSTDTDPYRTDDDSELRQKDSAGEAYAHEGDLTPEDEVDQEPDLDQEDEEEDEEEAALIDEDPPVDAEASAAPDASTAPGVVSWEGSQAPDTPEAAAGVAKPENLGGRGLDSAGEPLVAAEAQEEFLSRWSQIQIAFLEDPAGAVESAETLVGEIGEAMLSSLRDRSSEYAAAGRAAADTEEMRLALREYRAFIGVILPKQVSPAS